MSTEESTTTAGISDIVFQIFHRIRHRDLALAKNFFKLVLTHPRKSRRVAERKFALAIESNGRFEMQLRPRSRRMFLQLLAEIIWNFQRDAHANSLAGFERVAIMQRMPGGHVRLKNRRELFRN